LADDGLQVDSTRLLSIADLYDRKADELAAAVPSFGSEAHPPDDAFGMLGPAHDSRAMYLQALDATVTALNDTVTELRARAGSLRATAALYESSDR
jgi:hypothetical protein